MKETFAPLIPSNVAGPLGVMHLPRLWLVCSLKAHEKLAPGYGVSEHQYDMIVLVGLGLKIRDVVEHIRSKQPTYPQFEAWIKAQPGVKLSHESIAKINANILGCVHNTTTRQKIHTENNLPEQDSENLTAVDLNNLRDWLHFHEDVLSQPIETTLPDGRKLPLPAPCPLGTLRPEPLDGPDPTGDRFFASMAGTGSGVG